jgi:two-component system, NtrC family, nitrogen regulation response regulator GlnG
VTTLDQDSTLGKSRRRVLVADDDDSVRILCTIALQREGYLVDCAADGREALTSIEANDYHAILLDLGMPYVHGSTLLSIIQQTKPEMLRRVLVMTGAHDGAVEPLIGVAGAILRKPIEIDQLLRVVDQAGANATGDDTLRVA